MFTYAGLGNALPHSSDRNDEGGDGVATGWGRVGRRLGGHASITFGYQAKASGKDTGWPWPAPGFKGYAHAADPAPHERLVSKVAGWGGRESGMSQYKM